MPPVRIPSRRSPRQAAGILLTLVGCLTVAAASPAAAQPAISFCGITGASQLFPGCELQNGQALDDGTLALTMQGDGNVVLTDQGYPVWANGETGHPNSDLIMQYDGNLVEYSPQGAAVWSTSTTIPNSYAQLTSSGGFGVYDQCCRLWGTPLPGTSFQTATFPTDVVLPGQTDLQNLSALVDTSNTYTLHWVNGMLLLTYKPFGNTLQALGAVPCSSGAKAVMQTDGNFVISCNGIITYKSNTGGHPASAGLYLHLQSDGSLVIAASNGNVIARI